MQPRRSMGWAAAILLVIVCAPASAAGRDVELRIGEKAAQALVSGMFPLRHEARLAGGISLGLTLHLTNPRLTIRPDGIVVTATLTLTGAGRRASGPARFVLVPRYDARERILHFDVTESRADLRSGNLALEQVDLSWIATDLFIPLAQWVDGGTGPSHVSLVPTVRLNPGEMVLRGRVEVRKPRAASASADAGGGP